MSTQTLSRILYGLTVFCLIALPFLVIGTLVAIPPTPADAALYFTRFPISEQLAALPLWTALALYLLPIAILMTTLNQMRHLTHHTRQATVLSHQAARHISRIGLGLFALALCPLLLVPAQSALLSLNNDPGARSVSLGISGADIGFLLGAVLLTLLGRALREAAVIADENRSFV